MKKANYLLIKKLPGRYEFEMKPVTTWSVAIKQVRALLRIDHYRKTGIWIYDTNRNRHIGFKEAKQ